MAILKFPLIILSGNFVFTFSNNSTSRAQIGRYSFLAKLTQPKLGCYYFTGKIPTLIGGILPDWLTRKAKPEGFEEKV